MGGSASHEVDGLMLSDGYVFYVTILSGFYIRPTVRAYSGNYEKVEMADVTTIPENIELQNVIENIVNDEVLSSSGFLAEIEFPILLEIPPK